MTATHDSRSGGSKPRPRRSLRRRVLRWGVASLGIGFLVLSGGVFLVIPWLGERGELNYLVEDVISSMLDVPVRIDAVESEPLGSLSVTRLRSVSAAAVGKLRFEAEEISVRYKPLQIMRGEIRQVSFVRPRLFINLDEDLRGVAFLPEFPQAREPAADASPLALPFTLRRLVIDSGTATVRVDGRDLDIEDLWIAVDDLGSTEGLRYELRARVLEATFEMRGRVEVTRDSHGNVVHRLPENEIQLKGVRASSVFPWLRSRDWRLGDSEADRVIEAVDSLIHSAAIDLSGTVDGVWGEQLGIRLVTRFDDLIAGDPESIEVLGGRLDLLLEASVFGVFDSIAFRMDSFASGTIAAAQRMSDESGSLHVAGQIERTASGASSLSVSSARGTLLGGGELEFAGKADGVFRDEGAELDARIDVRNVRTAKILEFVPPEVIGTLPAALSSGQGEFSGHIEIGGTARAPIAQGRFDVRGAALRLPGTTTAIAASAGISFEGLRFDRELGSGSIGRLAVDLDSLEAPDLVDSIRAHLVDFPAMTGQARVSLAAEEVTYADGHLDGGWRVGLAIEGSDIEWVDGSGGFYGVDASAELEIGPRDAKGERRIRGAGSAKMRELLWRDVYAKVDDETFAVSFEGDLAFAEDGGLESLRVSDGRALTPVTGPVQGDWAFARQDDSGEIGVSASLRAPELPVSRAYDVFLRDPLATDAEAFESSSLEGVAGASLGLAGTFSRLTFDFVFEPRGVRWRLGDLVVEGLRGSIPLRWGPDISPSRRTLDMTFDRASRGPLEIPGRRLRFEIDGEEVAFVGPLDLPFFGGSVRIASARYVDGDLSTELEATGISLEQLTLAYGLPRVSGLLSADLGPISLRDGTLSFAGELRAEAFGGLLRVARVEVRDVFEPYSNLLVGEIEARDLELVKLGETFRFGIASGVLRGRVQGLEFTAGELTSFDLDLETVRRHGIEQYIDRRAIESIRRVLAGPFGAIEETFFSRFYFDRFGFVARLENGTFYLEGKQRQAGVDYLMSSRWYQFPQVSIINARPDQPYDWASIVENLRSIYRGDTTAQVFAE